MKVIENAAGGRLSVREAFRLPQLSERVTAPMIGIDKMLAPFRSESFGSQQNSSSVKNWG